MRKCVLTYAINAVHTGDLRSSLRLSLADKGKVLGMRRPIRLSCYAVGNAEAWEAICTDLDIAVQGNSLRDVSDKLNEAIHAYVDYVETLPEDERRSFLSRKAPWHVRIGCMTCSFITGLFRRKPARGKRLNFTIPCEV